MFVLVEFQLPVQSKIFGVRLDIRHADKQDSFKTFNIFFPLQLMIMRLRKQMMVLIRARLRSLMRLQGYLLPVAEEVEVSTETNPQNPENPDDEKDNEEDNEEDEEDNE